VQPDPVPPRHTFDDDSSSDDESDGDPSNRQVSEYQDVDDQTPPKPKERLMELDDIKVSLNEEIQDCRAVVIGVELLHDVNKLLGSSKEVGTISTETVYTLILLSNDLLGESRANLISNKLPFPAQNLHHRHSTSTASPDRPPSLS